MKALQRHLTLFAALLGALLVQNVDTASGCSCIPLTTQDAFDRADFVVQATVTCMTLPDPYPSAIRGDTMMVVSTSDMVLYTIRVSKVWKGQAESVDRVYSARGGSSCGYGFKSGVEYLIFGSVDDYSDRRWVWACDPEFPVKLTGLCSGTTQIGSATEALGVLGPPLLLLGDRQESK